MKKQILLCILSCIANSILSQTPVIGKVIQSDGTPIEYFTVRFLADTTILASGAFVGGQFSTVVSTSVNSIEVSAWGFDPDRKTISAMGDTILFSLTSHQHELGEVDVVANKRNLTVDGSNFILDVEGTNMSELGNINDVLCKVPLLMKNEKNEITMFGKDNIVVYVNNRRIKNKKELESMNPKTIKNVKLISSPGARYDADADAVISITTKDNNGTEMTARNIATKGRHFSDATNATLDWHRGMTNIHADYTFTASENKSYEGSTIGNKEKRHKYNDDEESTEKIIGHSYSIAGEHTFGNEHKIYVQFVGWEDRGNTEVEGNQQYYNNIESSSVGTQRKTAENSSHYDAGAGYDFKLGKQSWLSISTNYTIHNVETNSEIMEDMEMHNYDFDSKYQAIDAQVDYKTTFDNGLNIDAGGKVSAVSNKSESTFDSNNTALESEFSYQYDFREKIIGSYIDLDKSFGDVDVNVGLRVERTGFEGNRDRRAVKDTTYFSFAPNLKLTYITDGKNKLSLTYRSTISRPSFRNICPSIRYDNAFYYRRGNPSLLPTITSNITLAWNMGSIFWMNLGYRHKRNATIYQYADATNGNAIEAIMSNHRHIHFVLVSAGYNISRGRFSSSNSISITKPIAKVWIYNGVYKIDRCAYYFKTINDLTICKNLSVNADFIYNDLGETLLEKKDAMYNLSVGATAHVLDRTLSFSLAANDILDTYTYKDHREFGFYDVDHRYDPDNTYVRLTIRYLFRSGKTKKIRAIKSNSQTIDRL